MKRVTNVSVFAHAHILLRPWYFHGFVIIVLCMLLLSTISYGRAQLFQELDYSPVLIAQQPIDAGTKITQEQLTTQNFLIGHVPQNAIGEDEIDEVVGKYTLNSLAAGDVIGIYTLSDAPKPVLGSMVEKDKYVLYLDGDQLLNIPPHITSDVFVSVVAADPKSDKKQLLVNETKIIDTLGDSSKKGTPVVGVGIIATKDETLAISSALAQKWLLQLAIKGSYEKSP